jgi:hypothetical protein
MRMAKMQKATLDPSKISGYCGRLKCCLRYEDQTYTDLKRNLPKKNTWVKTKKGEGKVVDGHILTQLVVVEHDNGEQMVFPLDEITILPYPPARRSQPQEATAPSASAPAPRLRGEPKAENAPEEGDADEPQDEPEEDYEQEQEE